MTKYIIWIPFILFLHILPHPLQRMIIDQSRLLCPTCLAFLLEGAGPTFSSSLRIPIIKPEKKALDLGAKSAQETVSSHKVIPLMEEIRLTNWLKVYPIIYRRFIHPNGGLALGFLNHQQYEVARKIWP